MSLKQHIVKSAFLSNLGKYIPGFSDANYQIDAANTSAAEPSPAYTATMKQKGFDNGFYGVPKNPYADKGPAGIPEQTKKYNQGFLNNFQENHGTPMDMNSRVDRAKLADMTPPRRARIVESAPASPSYKGMTPEQLFQRNHASSFNPKSKMDIGKMKQITDKYYNKQ